jgi:trimeric autotransporter adhesin
VKRLKGRGLAVLIAVAMVTAVVAPLAGAAADSSGPAPLGVLTPVAGGPGRGSPALVSQVPVAVAVSSSQIVLSDPTANVVRRIDRKTGAEGVMAIDGLQLSGPSLAGRLLPPGVVIASDGSTYVADTGGSTVRKVASDGTVSTVAGSGAVGWSGDNGPATDATLNHPTGLALDAAGGLYIADTGNCVLRRVVLAVNQITTVAGKGSCGPTSAVAPGTAANAFPPPTQATKSDLNSPTGLAVDPAGDLFIASTPANEVDEIPATSTSGPSAMQAGDLYTVAGGGAAGFSSPTGLTAGSNGVLFVADTGHCQVKTVTPTSGDYSAAPVVAVGTSPTDGSSPCGSGGDGGPATSGQLAGPTGVALDSNGDLYVADGVGRTGGLGNDRLRKVAGGTVTTVAGTGHLGYSGDNGPAADAELGGPTSIAHDSAGNLLLADPVDNVVRKVNTGGTISTGAGTGAGCLTTASGCYNGDGGAATAALLNQPHGVAANSGGDVFIADTSNCIVRKVAAAGGAISTVAGVAPVLHPADGTHPAAYHGPPSCGAAKGTTATSTQLARPTGVAVDKSGDVFIADTGNDRVVELTTGGALVVVIGTGVPGSGCAGSAPGSTTLDNPTGIAFDAAGNLLIADTSNDDVCKVSPGTNGGFASGATKVVAGTGALGYSGDGGDATKAQLASPAGVFVDPAGNLFVADTGNQRVREVTPQGTIDTVMGSGTAGLGGAGGPAAAAELDSPESVSVAPSGSVLVADTNNKLIRGAGVVHPPGSPTGVGAVAGDDGSATVTWTAPTSDGGSPVTGYTVTASPGGASATVTGTSDAPPATTANIPGLTDGTAYTFTVVATNVAGDGPPSAPSSSVTAHGSSGDTSVLAVGPVHPQGHGYWMAARDGGVFAFGNSHFFGSMGGQPLNKPVVGMASTPDGLGYWLVASDGGLFAYGDAQFYGSMGGQPLNKPVVGMAATPDGLGYWLVASDGGLFAYGDAHFFGSLGGLPLNKPVVGMASTPDAAGYWLVASDGGLFAYGNAGFFGSTADHRSDGIIGMAADGAADGYWLAAQDGQVSNFGGAPSLGQVTVPAAGAIVAITGF